MAADVPPACPGGHAGAWQPLEGERQRSCAAADRRGSARPGSPSGARRRQGCRGRSWSGEGAGPGEVVDGPFVILRRGQRTVRAQSDDQHRDFTRQPLRRRPRPRCRVKRGTLACARRRAFRSRGAGQALIGKVDRGRHSGGLGRRQGCGSGDGRRSCGGRGASSFASPGAGRRSARRAGSHGCGNPTSRLGVSFCCTPAWIGCRSPHVTTGARPGGAGTAVLAAVAQPV